MIILQAIVVAVGLYWAYRIGKQDGYRIASKRWHEAVLRDKINQSKEE